MNKTNQAGFYYTNQLWFSAAYQKLTLNARNLLQIFITELKYKRQKSKDGDEKVWTNNGEVSCTESEYRGLTGCASNTYLSARNQLIEFGLIKQIHRGGEHRGDRSKYKVFISPNGRSIESERWREYPNKNWKHEIPKSKKQLIGNDTQWKKGECGRKINNTLKDERVNNNYHPNELNP